MQTLPILVTLDLSQRKEAIFLLTEATYAVNFTKVSQRLPGGMRKNKTVYVAETDKNGRVLCVWVHAHGKRSARPFNPKRDRFDMTDETQFSGTRPEVIKSWLARKKQDGDDTTFS